MAVDPNTPMLHYKRIAVRTPESDTWEWFAPPVAFGVADFARDRNWLANNVLETLLRHAVVMYGRKRCIIMEAPSAKAFDLVDMAVREKEKQ